MVSMNEEELGKWMRFAHRVAVKYAKRWDPEFISLANRALLRAIRSYDESKGVPLYGWIAFLVRRAIAYYWRRNKRLRTIQDQLFWDSVPAREEPATSAAWEALDTLSEFDRSVAIDLWIEGLTIEQIAAKHEGVSVKRLGSYIGKLRGRVWALREELGHEAQS